MLSFDLFLVQQSREENLLTLPMSCRFSDYAFNQLHALGVGRRTCIEVLSMKIAGFSEIVRLR